MAASHEPPERTGRLPDPLNEALRLIDLAHSAGLQLRLLGGLAFHAKVPSWTARIDREGRDIDLATRTRDKRPLASMLTAEGYVPDKGYNAIHGYKQLYFTDPETGRPVDVLIDRMEMCHRVEFARRLNTDYPTLPLAELLMSKLQIVRINRKDILDILVLIAEYPLAESDSDGINVRPLVEACSDDWGWWRTVTTNLEMLERFCADELQPADLSVGRPSPHDPVTQIRTIRDYITESRKSLRWRIRAQVGDRVVWYKEPEEVGHAAL